MKFKERIDEIKKISWCKPKDLAKNSILVAIFTVIMTLIIYFEDLIISSVSTIIENLF